MRIAIVSDIHGNRGAFEAEIVDQIRDLGWQGVVGNTDKALFRPESLEEFASQSSAPPSLWAAIRDMAATTRAALGEERIAWLRGLLGVLIQGPIALVHASPGSYWRAPGPEASDAGLESVYLPLGQPIAIYQCQSFLRRR